MEHGQQEVFFAALVLVAIDGKHDRLQQGIDLGHGDQPTEVGNVAWFGLQEEEEVAIFLSFFVVGERSLLHVDRILKMACDFVLLPTWSVPMVSHLQRLLDIPLRVPFGFESEGRFWSRDISHPSRGRSFSWTGWISWI